MCLYPKLIINPKYKPNKKNGGNPPLIHDKRIKYVPIGCQQCLECRKQKARSWQVRLSEDIKTNTNGKFITLTFRTEALQHITARIKETCINTNRSMYTGYALDNQIATYATRHFLERWRKQYGRSLRHWFVTELGHENTEHLHIHGIIWTNEPYEAIRDKWQYGYIYPRQYEEKYNYVTEQSINYLVKYVNKIDKQHKTYQSIILTSPGIGNGYKGTSNKYNEEKTNETYRTRKGLKLNLPIYYRNKIYTEQQREQLWIYKLNKNERWILGNKIKTESIKQQIEFSKALKSAQKINQELGYGKPITWEEAQYENERRILMQLRRINTERLTPAGRRI